MLTPSAAVISGLLRIAPPLLRKLCGVIGVPSALKNIFRGPSEVNDSAGELLLKGAGGLEAAAAATPSASTAQEWPFVSPLVKYCSWPRHVNK